MRFDLHIRASVREQISQLAEEMKTWEEQPLVSDADAKHLRDSIQFFPHTTHVDKLTVAGVDGSGDYPAVAYADSFVYVSVAHGTTYVANQVSGLREVEALTEPIVHVTWIPEEKARRRKAFDEAFSFLAGRPVVAVVAGSDYLGLKRRRSRKRVSAETLADQLIRPHASDSGNIAIQLRSSAEFGAALRLIEHQSSPDIVLVDTTLSLPSATLPKGSLFYEHLKRLCCVEARRRGIGLFALSKSHGLPAMQHIEMLAREKGGYGEQKIAEHWYLRLPTPDLDDWTLAMTKGRNVPPLGAISYLVRFHRNTPVMRLDIDRTYWLEQVRGSAENETLANEQRIFAALDYTCHDQRSYGYPYPIKAAHDRASLTKAERVALRKQIIDAAVKAGMKRMLFRDASIATGHR